MPHTSLSPDDGTFEVQVNDRNYNIRIEAGELYLNDEAVDYSFDRIGENTFLLRIDKESISVVVEPGETSGKMEVTIRGRRSEVLVKDEKDLLLEEYGLDEGPLAGEQAIRAPMPGLVLRVAVEEGEEVEAGQGLIVLEAMKMENELSAPVAGTVQAIHATEGDAVDKDELLIEIG